jgi:hypothetical protein
MGITRLHARTHAGFSLKVTAALLALSFSHLVPTSNQGLTGAYVIEIHVNEHSLADVKTIRELQWPSESVVASICQKTIVQIKSSQP